MFSSMHLGLNSWPGRLLESAAVWCPRDLAVLGGAVFWPVQSDPLSALLECSDHRPVYLDIRIIGNSASSNRADTWK